MAAYKDIIIDSTGDMEIANGDVNVNLSDSQHIEHIITTDRGQFRQWPLVGVGLLRQINGTISQQSLRQQMKLQLESDNYNVRKIKFDPVNPLNIDIDVERKNI
jgi:hypothetical protein